MVEWLLAVDEEEGGMLSCSWGKLWLEAREPLGVLSDLFHLEMTGGHQSRVLVLEPASACPDSPLLSSWELTPHQLHCPRHCLLQNLLCRTLPPTGMPGTGAGQCRPMG